MAPNPRPIALIIVDVQNDFVPGGALAVPAGDEVIAPINRLSQLYDVVIATRDFHPADHISFASNHPGSEVGQVIDVDGTPQVLWPDHCVAGTGGAELHPDLDTSVIDKVFMKGTNRRVDSYSAFWDNGRLMPTPVAGYLRDNGVREVVVCGLALDYCVRYTVFDALDEGFAVTLAIDATRAVNLSAGDGDAAVEAMREAGVRVMTVDEILFEGKK